MARNLLLIQPYSSRFYDTVINNLHNAFAKEDISNIEIQFKFALPKYFHLNFNENQLRDLPPAIRRKVEEMLLRQSEQFLHSLKVLSAQNALYLNPLGKQTYGLISGFNQFQFKKFYHIRDLFTKLGIYTESTEYQVHEPTRQPINMYQELANANLNYTIKMVQENQIRLDLYVKEFASPQLQGRYSYTGAEGWKKTVKEPLCQQMDYAFAEHLFRMAVNKEVEIAVADKDMEQIAKICKSTTKAFDIRLKRQMRVRKGDIFQFTFSEIYNINDLRVCSDVANLMGESRAVFDRFIRKLFINFFSVCQKQLKTLGFQMELELTKQSNERLKNWLAEKRYDQVKRELATVIEELMAIFYADHTTKVKEMAWMNHLVPRQVIQGRLQNQFGTHMRERIYRLMDESIEALQHGRHSSEDMFRQ